MNNKDRQNGFSLVEGLLLILVVAILGFAGWYVYRTTHKTNDTKSAQTTHTTYHSGQTSNQVVYVSDADNGKTVDLSLNQSLTLTLASTYWTIAESSNPQVVKMAGSQTTTPSHAQSCVPGEGCGTAVAHFSPAAAGVATISASRSSCGEARGCVGGEGNFSITVDVK